MERSSKQKWQIRIAVVAIFALGFMAGAMSWNFYRSWRFARSFEGRRDRYEQMFDRLNLTPDQRIQVEKILSETRTQLIELRKQFEPRMEEVRQQTDQRLQAVLTPEQWEQFKQIRNESRGRYRRGRERWGER